MTLDKFGRHISKRYKYDIESGLMVLIDKFKTDIKNDLHNNLESNYTIIKNNVNKDFQQELRKITQFKEEIKNKVSSIENSEKIIEMLEEGLKIIAETQFKTFKEKINKYYEKSKELSLKLSQKFIYLPIYISGSLNKKTQKYDLDQYNFLDVYDFPLESATIIKIYTKPIKIEITDSVTKVVVSHTEKSIIGTVLKQGDLLSFKNLTDKSVESKLHITILLKFKILNNE